MGLVARVARETANKNAQAARKKAAAAAAARKLKRLERRLHGYAVDETSDEEDASTGSSGSEEEEEEEEGEESRGGGVQGHRGGLRVSTLDLDDESAVGGGGGTGPPTASRAGNSTAPKIRNAGEVLKEMTALTADDFVKLRIADRASQSPDGRLRHPDAARFMGVVRTAAARFSQPPGRHPYPSMYNGWIASYVHGKEGQQQPGAGGGGSSRPGLGGSSPGGGGSPTRSSAGSPLRKSNSNSLDFNCGGACGGPPGANRSPAVPQQPEESTLNILAIMSRFESHRKHASLRPGQLAVMEGLAAVFNGKHVSMNHSSVNVDIVEEQEPDAQQWPPRLNVIFQGRLYAVKWVEEEGAGGIKSPLPSPAKGLNLVRIEERVGGRVQLSNGCLFENPKDTPQQAATQEAALLKTNPGSSGGRRSSRITTSGSAVVVSPTSPVKQRRPSGHV
jgi:hypothetical protein